MKPAIETRALTRRFGTRTAVEPLDLEIRKGELFALLGPNGAGKTTTIRMLCCLLPPTGGDAWLLGSSIRTAPAEVRQRIGISPQETAVAPNLTARENLEFIARLYGASAPEARRRADRSLGELGLMERAGDRAKSLSGGLQRRLSIAMALIPDPEVLFLDEPTLGLDVRARRELWELLRGLKGEKTVVLTTHYLEEGRGQAGRHHAPDPPPVREHPAARTGSLSIDLRDPTGHGHLDQPVVGRQDPRLYHPQLQGFGCQNRLSGRTGRKGGRRQPPPLLHRDLESPVRAVRVPEGMNSRLPENAG